MGARGAIADARQQHGVLVAISAADGTTSLADHLEERLIGFAATIVEFASNLPTTPACRHIASQILRSGTAPAPKYAEARGAESRADFVHKLGIVQKELNETSAWLRILAKINLGNDDTIVAILRENIELSRIIAASIRTVKVRRQDRSNDP